MYSLFYVISCVFIVLCNQLCVHYFMLSVVYSLFYVISCVFIVLCNQLCIHCFMLSVVYSLFYVISCVFIILKDRREKHRLTYFNKMNNGLTPGYLSSLVPNTLRKLCMLSVVYSLFYVISCVFIVLCYQLCIHCFM